MKLKDRAWHAIIGYWQREIDAKAVNSSLDEMIWAWLAGYAAGRRDARRRKK